MADEPELTEAEIAKRRDDALRRALNTPPKPRKGSASSQNGAEKRGG